MLVFSASQLACRFAKPRLYTHRDAPANWAHRFSCPLFGLSRYLKVFLIIMNERYHALMTTSKEIRRGRTCVFLLHVHLVFVTKYRRRVFTKTVLNHLERIFSGICDDFEATLVEFDGEEDHVHLLVNYPPTVSISRMVNSLKGVSSRLIRKKNYPSVKKALWGKSLWSPSYFAGSCGGAPLALIAQYIQQQKTPTQ